MRVFVIIPTYNEIDNIGKTIEVVFGVLDKLVNYDSNILVVDGNSPDKTADKVRELQKTYPKLHLLAKTVKGGLGADYVDGLNMAFEDLNADVAITFDADLSHDPEKIPDFLENIKNGSDFVNGTRYKKGGGIPKEWALHRKAMSFLGNWFVKTLYFGSSLTDFTSGFKALTKNTYKKIISVVGIHPGYTFSISMNIEPYREGLKISEVPYYFKDRTVGKSKMGFDYMINALIFITKLRITDFLSSRFGKVFIAGGAGSLAQLASFGIIFHPLIENPSFTLLPNETFLFGLDIFPQFLFSTLLAIEVGLTVAFIVNNLWAFKESKLTGILFVRRYIKNHFVVLGAIIIQLIIIALLSSVFGNNYLLKYAYQIIGILIGLLWNFYFYQRIIWKTIN